MHKFLCLQSLSLVLGQLIPDQYGWACYRIADSRKWPECETAKGKARKNCLCGLNDFVGFTQNCLATAITNATDLERAITDAQKSLCPGSIDTFFIDENTAEKGDKGNTRTVSLERLELQKTKSPPPELDDIKSVGDDELQRALLTARWRIKNDVESERFGMALLLYWLAAVLVASIVHLGQVIFTQSLRKMAQWKLCRMIRTYLLYPALFSQKHSQLVTKRWIVFHLPTRITTVLIAGFAVLDWILLFSNYAYESRNILFTTPTQQFYKTMSIRGGYLVVYKLPLLTLFAGRNNLLQYIAPWSFDTFNVFHKWISRITFFDLCVHAVSISLLKVEQQTYKWYWGVWYWRWGVSGALLAGLLVFHSMRFLVRHHYDLFVACHVALAIAFLIAAYYHVLVLPVGSNQVIAACAIWGFDHVARLARILFIGGKVDACITHYDHISVVEAKLPRFRNESYARLGGAYCFVHFPLGMLRWQSHPFSIVKEEEKLVMCILHKKGITSKILQIPEGPLGIALDGPYGTHHSLRLFPQVVFIAGGIGITVILSYLRELQSYSNVNDDSEKYTQRLTVHWAVSDPAKIEWAARRLAGMREFADIHIYISDNKAITLPDAPYRGIDHQGRLSCEEVVANACKEPAYDATAVFACGPGPLNDDARKATCKAIMKGRRYITYFEESFSW